jgi:hypothetical protein
METNNHVYTISDVSRWPKTQTIERKCTQLCRHVIPGAFDETQPFRLFLNYRIPRVIPPFLVE